MANDAAGWFIRDVTFCRETPTPQICRPVDCASTHGFEPRHTSTRTARCSTRSSRWHRTASRRWCWWSSIVRTSLKTRNPMLPQSMMRCCESSTAMPLPPFSSLMSACSAMLRSAAANDSRPAAFVGPPDTSEDDGSFVGRLSTDDESAAAAATAAAPADV